MLFVRLEWTSRIKIILDKGIPKGGTVECTISGGGREAHNFDTWTDTHTQKVVCIEVVPSQESLSYNI